MSRSIAERKNSGEYSPHFQRFWLHRELLGSTSTDYTRSHNCTNCTSAGTTDSDGDGYVAVVDGGDDCRDNDSAWHPGASACPGVGGDDKDCNNQDDYEQCSSPIIIDVLSNGFKMTDAVTGVLFDINADGNPEQLSWTATGSDDAWLVLDRDGDGLITSGRELFGNYTEQPQEPGVALNGFLALAEFDKVNRSGNDDGQITSSDGVFSQLRLWQDINHNGISEPEELHLLPSLGVRSIDLNYSQVKRQQFPVKRRKIKISNPIQRSILT